METDNAVGTINLLHFTRTTTISGDEKEHLIIVIKSLHKIQKLIVI